MTPPTPTSPSQPGAPARGMRFPLGARIFLWFLLNLALLLTAAWILIRFQFATGIDSFLANQIGDRMQPLIRLIHEEIRERPLQDWDSVLDRFSTNAGVRFYLFQNEHQQLAGDPITLPGEVIERMNEGREERPEQRPPPGPGGGRPRFFVRSENPSGYWLGQRLLFGGRDRARERDRERRPSDRPEINPTPPPVAGGGRPVLLVYSESLSAGGVFLDHRPVLITGTAALIISLLFWLPLVRGITRSIRQAKNATQEIAEGRFDVRVDTGRSDELGDLGHGINQMAIRLDGLVTGQKRFLGDVAHELCAPLARAQMSLGILEHQIQSGGPVSLEDLQVELEEMSQLVNELLSFSKASLGKRELVLESLVLADLAQTVVQRETPPGKGNIPPIQIQILIPPTLTVMANRELLSRAVGNLVRNAIRYAGEQGPIEISAQPDGDWIRLSVKDSGPGVPPDALEKIFDPFFRVDASRNRETGGTGLGLAIVKTCVDACGGTVRATSNQPKGLQVTLTLKRADR